MREDLKRWAEDNLLDVVQTGPHTYRCGGQSFVLLEEREGVICSKDFCLSPSVEEAALAQTCGSYLYRWGTKFFWTPASEIENLSDGNMKPFLYIGDALCSKPGYPMLGIHGEYEMLNGSREYKDWVKKAKFLGISALGICEKNTLAGTLKFQIACKEGGVKAILGETVSIHTDRDEFLEGKVYAMDERGWKNLLLINTEINVVNGGKWISESRILELGEGVIFIAEPLRFHFIEERLEAFSKAFSRFYYKIDTVIWDSEATEASYLEEMQKYLASSYRPAIICDAYYLDKADSEIKQDLNTIAGSRENISRNQHFKCDDENMGTLLPLFEEDDFDRILEEAYASLEEIASSCNYEIELGKPKLPDYKMTEEEAELYETNEELFNGLIIKGFDEKGIGSLPSCEEYIERIEEEKSVIKDGGFIDYFLILHDIIRWCHKNDILVGFGRGSAAGSLISYLLGIVNVDPIEYGLLFERFLTRERAVKGTPPDIDSDIEASRRDDVKNYMISRYGEERVCSLGTYSSMQMKAAFKDFAKLQGTPVAEVSYMSEIIDDTKDNQNMRASRAPYEYLFKLASRSKVLYNYMQEHLHMFEEMRLCWGQPRNASVHACAMLILPKGSLLPVTIPVRKGYLNGKEMIVSEWEGTEIEAAGYLKEDILGIRQLDKFRMIISLAKSYYGEDIDIYSVPLNIPEVYEMFCKGRTGDVFHIGSRGLTSYCVQMKPEKIHDLIAAIALYRPGPLDNGFHMRYINRKQGHERVRYPQGLEKVLKDTYGLFVYQEQVMQACTTLASFSLTEADNIRKGMGKSMKKYLESYGEKFVEGGVAKGYDAHYLEELWEQMCTFGRYGFNRCLSSSTTLYRFGLNRSTENFSIGEMYKIKNDFSYAKRTGHLMLRMKYIHRGYGSCLSLNEDNRLIKNKIKDIRYVGIRPVYEMLLESGKSIRCTLNHKFPTSNGEKMLENIDIEKDLIFVSSYEMGRRKVDEKGFLTHFEKIVSVEYVCDEEVYDVEMEHPYHTLTLDNGIVTSNSHAACYAITAYVCNYLKWKYPLPYWITALQFSDSTDGDVLKYIAEINQDGRIRLLPPDINKSQLDFYADPKSNHIFWSISKIKFCGPTAIQAIFDERNANGEFYSLQEFFSRVNVSKVNKRVIENLILSGAFDSLEAVSRPSDRLRLIEGYRMVAKVKASKSDDIFDEAIKGGKAAQDWWWLLMQREVCGLAFFNFNDIFSRTSFKIDQRLYVSIEEIRNMDFLSRGGHFLVFGIVSSLEVKQAKKGDYALLTIDENYSPINVMIWSEEYLKHKKVIDKCLGKITAIYGRGFYDSKKGENALQSDSKFEIYVIE